MIVLPVEAKKMKSLLFLLLDHLLNYITADRTVLFGSQVSAIIIYKQYA